VTFIVASELRKATRVAGAEIIVARSIQEYKTQSFCTIIHPHRGLVLPQTAGLEQRLIELEAQISRLTAILLRSHETGEEREPIERRLAELTDQCTGILQQCTATSERYAHAVGELETRLTGWNDIESRLQRDAAWRFQNLERTIGREWASLRLLHEEPARQLREQAESLTEICVNTAGSAQTGIERAEARLATLEHDLHRKIDHLSSDLHAVLTELRQHGVQAARKPAAAWPLDEVTRLHHELAGRCRQKWALRSRGPARRRLSVRAGGCAAASEPSREMFVAAAASPGSA
jgi:hypothetical protein